MQKKTPPLVKIPTVMNAIIIQWMKMKWSIVNQKIKKSVRVILALFLQKEMHQKLRVAQADAGVANQYRTNSMCLSLKSCVSWNLVPTFVMDSVQMNIYLICFIVATVWIDILLNKILQRMNEHFAFVIKCDKSWNKIIIKYIWLSYYHFWEINRLSHRILKYEKSLNL